MRSGLTFTHFYWIDLLHQGRCIVTFRSFHIITYVLSYSRDYRLPKIHTMQRAAIEETRSPAEAALLARIERYFHDAICSLPNRDRAKALSAPDDFWTLVETLALAPIKESAEQKVRIRGAIARHKLLEQDGGVLSPSSVGTLLGITRQAVGLRRRAGKLLGVESGRGYVYPAWQFQDTGMVPGIEEIMEILGDADPMTNVIFFLGHDYALGGKRPIDLLLKGKLEDVKRAARTYGHHGTT